MTITTYRNFDLLITRFGDRYRAFVVDAPAGEARITESTLEPTNCLRLRSGNKALAGKEEELYSFLKNK